MINNVVEEEECVTQIDTQEKEVPQLYYLCLWCICMPIYCAACAIPTVSAVLGRDVDKGVADKIRKVNSGAGYGLEIPVHLHTYVSLCWKTLHR